MKILSSVLVSATLLLTGMWAAIWVQVEHERSAAIETAVNRNQNLAVAFEQYVTRTIQGADLLTRTMKAQIERAGAEAALHQAVADGLVNTNLYYGVQILDQNGFLLAGTVHQTTPGLNYGDREHFRVHRLIADLGVYIGKPIPLRLSEGTVIPITRRINLPDGSFGGVVIVMVKPSRFTEFYKDVSMEGDDFIALVGLDRITRVRRTGSTETFGDDLSKSSVFANQSQKASDNVLTRGYKDGEMRYISYRTLTDYPLMAAVGISQKEVMADVQARAQTLILLSAAVSLAIIGITALLVMALRRKDLAVMQLQMTERQLTTLALRDPLTKLPNRIHLEQRGEDLIEASKMSGRPMACLFIDLDNFKYHNDAHGHAVGDLVLQAVADEVQKLVRARDLLARLGGDEFVVLLCDLDDARQESACVAERILDRFANAMQVGGQDMTISVSIGISLFPENGLTLSELLRHADEAMYSSKERGRARYNFFSIDMRRQNGEKLQMESAMRRAIRNHEFELYYQPQINLRTGQPVGVEALLRWHNPEMGPIPTDQFIPIAEESGLIIPIGQWVLETACRQMRLWHASGLSDLQLSVNFSALQFKQPDLIETVSDVLLETGLNPRSLELELTESMLLGSRDVIRGKLERLKQLGVSLALDDFGTGYSNLQYLKKYPLDTLKIDRSFIADLPHDADGEAIAGAIISMAHSLDLRVIAEGIETQAQADSVIRKGCTLAQGYLYARPMSALACFKWLHDPKAQDSNSIRSVA